MASDRTIPTGLQVELGRFTFTAAEIVRFAEAYDPQPFHVDMEAAGRSPYGTLIASGWHTVATWMGLFVRALGPDAPAPGTPRDAAEVISPAGVGFGLKDLKWLEPVRAGDEIVFATVLDDVRASASRPGWSVFSRRALALRPDGTPVATFAIGHLAPTDAAIEARSAPGA